MREDDPRVVEQRRLLDKLTDDFKRLNERNEVRSAAWREAGHTLQAVEGWLKDGRPHGTVLQDHEGEVPKLNKGEGLMDAIERHRRRGRELKADLNRIQSAPFPSSYAKAQMRAQIEALAMQGAPNLSDLIENDRQIVWPTQRVQSNVVNTATPALAFAEFDAAIPFVVWLHRDAIIKRMDAEIDTEADDVAALTHAEREKRSRSPWRSVGRRTR